MNNNSQSIYTVRQINLYIKHILDNDSYLQNVYIKGEISNCNDKYGHVFFSLKDESGVLPAVMFAQYAGRLKFKLKEGMQVVVYGSIGVYERDGKYQLYVRDVQETGTGELFRKYEQLKNSLEERGMFAAEYKQPIPRFAMRIGVVTSHAGAVIRDIYNVASRRNPYCSIILAPAQVQGDGAAESICQGLKQLDDLGLDVIIVGRGGGSIEDLWCFNEESVAYAIFNCKTPVISAVGHETDFTIADFVADLRAPTPSAAAELAVFDYIRFIDDLHSYRNTLDQNISGVLSRTKGRLENYELKINSLSPERVISEKRHILDNLKLQSLQLMTEKIRAVRDKLDLADNDMQNTMQIVLRDNRQRLGLLSERLSGVSPLTRLSGGYAFVSDSYGKRIGSIKQLSVGCEINIALKDGNASAQVNNIEPAARIGTE